VSWIEGYCIHMSGRSQGKPAVFSVPERSMLTRAYNSDDLSSLPASGQLGVWVALLHIAGPEASQPAPPQFRADLWSIFRSASPRLRSSLQRRGETVVFVEHRRANRRA
jgi:hypothetical protein